MAGRRRANDPRNVHDPKHASITVFDEKKDDVGIPVWQRIGVQIPGEVITGQTALERAGALWKVKKVKSAAVMDDGSVVVDPNGYKLIREDNGAIVGSNVGAKYVAVQNEEAIKVLDPIVQSGLAVYDSVGVVYGGEITWTMLRMKEDLVLPGDDRVLRYLMFLNAHNGQFSLRIFPAPMRAWCANVLNSLARYFKEGISIRHTISAESRMDEAKRIIEASQGFYKEFGAKANALATKAMTDAQMNALIEHLFPSTEDEAGNEKLSSRTKNIREDVLKLWTDGAGHNRIRGTAWAGWNAITEYADHHRSTRVAEGGNEGEARFASVMFGSGLSLKGKALNWIEENVLKTP